MARPKRENRDDVAGTTLTIRITEPERVALDALVARRTAQLADEGYAVSAASLVRALIRQKAQAEGLLPAPAQLGLPLPARPSASATPVVAAPTPKASPSKGKAPAKSPQAAPAAAPAAALDVEGLRARYLAARDAGKLSNGDVAAAIGVDKSNVSRWAAGGPRGKLSDTHRPIVDSLLRKHGF